MKTVYEANKLDRFSIASCDNDVLHQAGCGLYQHYNFVDTVSINLFIDHKGLKTIHGRQTTKSKNVIKYIIAKYTVHPKDLSEIRLFKADMYDANDNNLNSQIYHAPVNAYYGFFGPLSAKVQKLITEQYDYGFNTYINKVFVDNDFVINERKYPHKTLYAIAMKNAPIYIDNLKSDRLLANFVTTKEGIIISNIIGPDNKEVQLSDNDKEKLVQIFGHILENLSRNTGVRTENTK